MRFAIPPSSKVRAVALPSYSAGLSRRPSRRRLLGANAPLGPRLRGDIRFGRTHPDRSIPGSLRRAGPTYSSPSTPVIQHDSTAGRPEGETHSPTTSSRWSRGPVTQRRAQFTQNVPQIAHFICKTPGFKFQSVRFGGRFADVNRRPSNSDVRDIHDSHSPALKGLSEQPFAGNQAASERAVVNLMHSAARAA